MGGATQAAENVATAHDDADLNPGRVHLAELGRGGAQSRGIDAEAAFLPAERLAAQFEQDTPIVKLPGLCLYFVHEGES